MIIPLHPPVESLSRISRVGKLGRVPVVETLAVSLGGALIKAIAKLWFKENAIAGGAADGISKILESKIKDFGQRRATERLFSSIQDDVARELDTVIQAEFPRLAENEQEAAIHATADVFDSLSLERDVFDADLDAARLEARALTHAPRLFQGLGQDARALTELLVRQSCNYVIRVASQLPQFQSAATAEILKRERELLDDVRRVLGEIAALRTQQSRAGANQREAFEERYRNGLVDRLDQLELFGLRLVGAGARRYPLTVAYVTLTANCEGRAQSGRVDAILSESKRILVRGEAGSGKTTLLQWLAVRAANRDFSGSLSGWNQRVPFFIRLRDYADHKLPAPEHFIEGTSRNLMKLMRDPDWVQQVLTDGNALVLVDGIDELPASRRDELGSWLDDLTRDFPANTFVVSSRPAAVDADTPELRERFQRRVARRQGARVKPYPNRREDGGTLRDRLEELEFETVELQGMSVSDSEALVVQWHAAVGKDLSGDEVREKLALYERELHAALRARPAVRMLATNPLLCAMICALNWERQQRLPDDRMELYSIALDLLLEARDAERRVPSSLKLESKDKRELLDSLAYWMLRNGYSEISRSQAVQQIEAVLPRFGRISAPAERVMQELLERSGVLRQPQHDSIDFVHRTFLEFMAAQAAVRADDLGMLVKQARDESWRETIVFAAGHAEGKARDDMVRDLLKKPLLKTRDAEATVTAVCCIETVGRSLDPDLSKALEALAHQLFPPRNAASAQLLAPAAALNPGWLFGHASEGEDAIAACIRTAWIVGGKEMLKAIAHYAIIEGALIDQELAEAWDSFDDSEFFEQVLKKRRSLFGIALAELSDEEFALLALLNHFQATEHREFREALTQFRDHHALMLSELKSDRRFAPTSPIASRALVRSPASSAPRTGFSKVDIKRLSTLKSLHFLMLRDARPEALEVLRELPALRHLWLKGSAGVSLAFLPQLASLEGIDVDQPHIESLGALAHCMNLQKVQLQPVSDLTLSRLRLSDSVTALELSFVAVSYYAPLTLFPQLESIELTHVARDLPVGWLQALPRLRRLRLAYTNAVAKIPYDSLKLEEVDLLSTQASLLERLSSAACLKKLSIAAHPRHLGASYTPDEILEVNLGQLPRGLEEVSFSGLRHLYLSAAKEFFSLRSIRIQGVERVQDLEGLRALPNLRSITLDRAALNPLTIRDPENFIACLRGEGVRVLVQENRSQ